MKHHPPPPLLFIISHRKSREIGEDDDDDDSPLKSFRMTDSNISFLKTTSDASQLDLL